MSILNVEKIQPIGSGSTVTINATDTILTNAQAGVITATNFVGSGANLTSLPAQATIANNADNRIITGGSGVNLNGEANLIFNGVELYPNSTDRDKVGHRLNYRRNAPNSRTNTGSASQRYYKISEITLNGSESAEINMYGTVGYSAGQEVAGKTTIIIRATNATTLVGFWYEETLGALNLSDVRWKYTGSNNVYELWVQANNYSNIAPFVRCTGNGYTSFNTDTGSNTAPSGSTALSTYNRKIIGGTSTVQYNPTNTQFYQDIIMSNDKGISFINADDTATGETVTSSVLDDYEEGSFTMQFNVEGQGNMSMAGRFGVYTKVGRLVTIHGGGEVSGNPAGQAHNAAIQFSNLPFTSMNSGVMSSPGITGSVNFNQLDDDASMSGTPPYTFHVQFFNNGTTGRIVARDSASTPVLCNASLFLKSTTQISVTITYMAAA